LIVSILTYTSILVSPAVNLFFYTSPTVAFAMFAVYLWRYGAPHTPHTLLRHGLESANARS